MQNKLKQISLRWISIFSDSESEYVEYNKQSDFLSSHKSIRKSEISQWEEPDFFPEIDFNSPLRTEHCVGIGACVSAATIF